MLFGQDGSGGHDCCLRTRFVHDAGGQGRHHGLTGTDISLQKAVHRLSGFQVETYVRDGLFLGVGQGEG